MMRRRSFLKAVAGFVPGVALAGRFGYGSPAEVAEPGNMVGEKLCGLARELAEEKRTVIGVFRDPVFAGYEVPASLRPEHFQEVWGAKKNVRVVFLDKDQIRSYSILFKGRMDILVYPYGEMYPMDTFPVFSGSAMANFLKRGGAVLTTGGIPFAQPVSDKGEPPLKNATKPGDLNLDNLLYVRWVAPLGYKYYVHPYQPTVTRVHQGYLPGLPAEIDVAGCPLGLVANNSSHAPVPKPSHGNVFPERYPARQVTPLLWGTDKYGQVLATNALLIQDFENGSRRIHLAHQAEPHPLSPNSSTFSALMNNLLNLLTNRVVVESVETNYACFRQHEPVAVRAGLLSFEPEETEVEVVLEIRGNGETVDSHTESLRLPARQSVTKEWHWTPEAFEADEYEVSVRVRRQGQTVSSGENGFVVWNDAVARRGPRVDIEGQYFRIGESESFLSGTNYYESTHGEMMWYRPNMKRIADDLRQMRGCGVNYIRPHYHHLKWFKDYLLFEHGRLFPYFASLQDVESPMPDERVWRIWDAIIYLCQKVGIVYGGDLFTLVPEEMGDPRGWSPFLESVECLEKRAVEQEFLRRINLRYKGVPGISWDLWNEPTVPVEALKDWTQALCETLRKTGVHRFVTVGGGTGEELGEAVDYLGIHGLLKKLRDTVNQTARPMMMQEVWMRHRDDLPSELAQAEDMRDCILTAVKHGFCGIAAWSWTRQMRLWQDSYEHYPEIRMESRDDRLGAQTHDDATIKPAGQVFLNLAMLLRPIRFVSFDHSSGRVTTSQGELRVKLKEGDQSPDFSLYHVSGGHCYAAMALTSAAWGGKPLLSGPSGGYVYIFSEDGADLFTAQQIYAKSESPGKLVLEGRAADPRSVKLVEISPLGNRTLDTLSWNRQAQGIEIDIPPTLQAYWVLAEW
ncbi:MAG TPA: hypothetical protein VMV34_05015 [Terriglobia bacterium]|nr:hypothetical protein [Terriglobia bacterium]